MQKFKQISSIEFTGTDSDAAYRHATRLERESYDLVLLISGVVIMIAVEHKKGK